VAFPLQATEARLGFRGVPETTAVVVQLNGQTLFDGPLASGSLVITRSLVKTAPKQLDQAESYLHLPLSLATGLRRGSNDWTITVAGAPATAQLTDLEVRFDYASELEPIWNRTAR
jgi:hypothetical protein